MKVMTILGTRPEIIRLSRVINLLENTSSIEHVLVHTGQNYDFELNQVFFENLNLREPDHFLEAAGESFGETYGKILWRSEAVMRQEQPDAVLILGDTNSALAAIIAKRLHIPVYHMEAGNRCFDFNVPEETNRRIVDHTADFNLVYTEHARRHLISEGLPHRRIYLSGSPMCEVLNTHKKNISTSSILEDMKLKKGGYFIVSAHREENVDNPSHLKSILGAINALVTKYDMPAIVSTHPRTRNKIDALKEFKLDSRITFSKPFGFFDYNRLQKDCFCAISDSGTIAEEASILDFPAITIRNAIERPEALDTGSIVMTGLDEETILSAVELVTSQWSNGIKPSVPLDYQITDTSQRVVRLILGTAKLSNKWHGIPS